MPSINEVLERTSRTRPDAIDDDTKAAWLIELDSKLLRDVIMEHESAEPLPAVPKSYPEDGDLPLLAGSPYDNLYDLYIYAMADLTNREDDHYNNDVTIFNEALRDYKIDYHKRHTPVSAGGYKNVY